MGLSTTEAHYAVLRELELERGLAVYELRPRRGVSLPTFATLGEVEGHEGTVHLVQVQVGKRPPRSRGLHVDKPRVAPTATLVAVVDPQDGEVHLVSRERACSGPILLNPSEPTGTPPNGPQTAAGGREAGE